MSDNDLNVMYAIIDRTLLKPPENVLLQTFISEMPQLTEAEIQNMYARIKADCDFIGDHIYNTVNTIAELKNLPLDDLKTWIGRQAPWMNPGTVNRVLNRVLYAAMK